MNLYTPDVSSALSRISKIPKGTILSPKQQKGTEAKLEHTKAALRDLPDYFERKGIDPKSEKAQKIDLELKTRKVFLRMKLYLFGKAQREERKIFLKRQFASLGHEIYGVRKNVSIDDIEFNV